MSEYILLLSVISVVDREFSDVQITYTGESSVDFRYWRMSDWRNSGKPQGPAGLSRSLFFPELGPNPVGIGIGIPFSMSLRFFRDPNPDGIGTETKFLFLTGTGTKIFFDWDQHQNLFLNGTGTKNDRPHSCLYVFFIFPQYTMSIAHALVLFILDRWVQGVDHGSMK